MAEIQIVYREGYCEYFGTDYCVQCHTACAGDMGCRMFDEGEHEENEIPFGDCTHAKFKSIYKGMTVKSYELEEFEDPINIHLNCMVLTVRNKSYYCDKVILDGKCIYDNTIDE